MEKKDHSGNVVQELINDWPVGIRAFYARVTERIELFGPNLGMPFTRSMGKGLFEIRAKGKEGIGRAFFCTVVNRKVVVLHAYTKKTQKTPQKEIKKTEHAELESLAKQLAWDIERQLPRLQYPVGVALVTGSAHVVDDPILRPGLQRGADLR